MKQGSIFALMLLLSSTLVFGQLEKGNYFLLGSSSLGLSNEKYTIISGGTSTEQSKTFSIAFQPKAGYFILDNLPIGLEISTGFDKTKYSNSDNKSSNSNFTIGPFARYYFLPQDKLKPMVEISAGFGTNKYKSTSSQVTNESKYTHMEYSFGAGASYFFTKNVAFDALLSYESDKYKLKSESHSGGGIKSSSGDSGDKTTGIDFHIGVLITIPK